MELDHNEEHHQHEEEHHHHHDEHEQGIPQNHIIEVFIHRVLPSKARITFLVMLLLIPFITSEIIDISTRGELIISGCSADGKNYSITSTLLRQY